MSSNPTSKSANRVEVLTPPTLDVDWSSIGMFSALRQIFALAIRTAFPEVIGTTEEVAVMSKCGNPTMGHYQCNNALGISKMLKSVASYTGTTFEYDCVCLCVCI